jgi:DNA polymerase III delta prime subunit
MLNKFIKWLEVNKPKSIRHYTSGYNTINKICHENGLMLLEYWDNENWEKNYDALILIEEFKELNSSGNNILTATLSNYKKLIMEKTSTIIIPPVIPFPEFKWRWAVTTPSESLNTEELLFGVLAILVNHNGERHATQEFKNDLLELQNRTGTSIDLAKVDRDINKNIIENSGQYWKALGLLNSTTDGTISVTDLGKGIIKGSISKLDFVKKLYNDFSLPNSNIESASTISIWNDNNIVVHPFKIIFNILLGMSKRNQSPTNWYIEGEELRDVVIPLSIYKDLDVNIYVDNILKYRNDKSQFSNWPNCAPGDNDFRMIKEYLLFLSNFGFLDLVELKDKSKRYYINSSTLAVLDGSISLEKEDVIIEKLIGTEFNYKYFHKNVKDSGLIFSEAIVSRFIASLCTKPFVICSGLSGSGKTKLAQAFAQWICYKEEDGEKNEQYCIVPVGADWTNREPLLGYSNALQQSKYVKPENGVLDLINRAQLNETKPYFLILDEMNLSHVERYFADFLSTMESGDAIPLHTIEDEEIGIPKQLNLPKNLFIIGTVNIDETTYMFSPKVLDRANTIEFRLTEADLEAFIDSDIPLDMNMLKGAGESMGESFVAMATQKTDKNLKKAEVDLKAFFKELKKSGAEFGYRTASEIARLMFMLELLGEKDDNLLDIAIMQKLLPKLHGSRNKLTKVLPVLGGFCLKNNEQIKENYLDKFVSNSITEEDLNKDKNIKYCISFEKICRMYKNAVENGFANYAEA